MRFCVSSRPAAAGMVLVMASCCLVVAREPSYHTAETSSYTPKVASSISEKSTHPPEVVTLGVDNVSSANIGAPAPDNAYDPRKSRNLKAPRSELATTAEKLSGRPVLLGEILAHVLYRLPWPAAHTDPKCSEDMRTYGVHVQNGTMWAARMLDATSKGPEGLLDGNIYGFGNFDQCISTKSNIHNISGGYTLVDIDYRPSHRLHPGFYNDDHLDDYEPLDDDKSTWTAINHNIQEDYVQRHKFQWAVCLPDTCDYKDVQKIVNNILSPEIKRHGMEANVTVDPMLHTSRQNTYKHTTGFYVVRALYMGLTGFIIVGTLYDFIFLYYRPKSEHGSLKPIMKPFSLISNLERLLKPAVQEEFSIINGYKFLFILQNMVGHRGFLEIGMPQSNPDFAYWIAHNYGNGFFKCYVYLETFFIISGYLTFCLLTKHLNENKHFSFIPIMIYRYLRTIPTYGILILTYIFILPYLNDGPYWRKMVYTESDRCYSNWWTNVLFINNYVNTDELCIIPAWYLACDMHFFIVGAPLTYVIWKWRKIGLTMLGACLTLSTVIPAYIMMKDQHYGVFHAVPEDLRDLSKNRFFTEVYIKSHMRSMTYFAGILTGYLFMRFKETGFKFSVESLKFSIPGFIIIANLIYMAGGWFSLIGHKYDAFEHTLYFTLSRIIWSIMIGHGLIAHGLTGLGVCVGGLLSNPVINVLGKLVFCIYMFQGLIQIQTVGSIRAPIYQKISILTWEFFADTMMALLYALAINVMVESPFDRLQKNFMKMFLGGLFSKKKPLLDTANNEDNTKSS